MQLGDAFGDVLRRHRQEHGLSQEQLAFQSGYHRTYISLLERGKEIPSLTAFFKLASALGCSPTEFVSAVEERLGESGEDK